MKHRRLIEWWADQMELVLQANDHKAGWEQMRPWEIHERLTEELEELTKVLAGADDGDAVQEAVDISNFCAFLGWNLAHKPKKRIETAR